MDEILHHLRNSGSIRFPNVTTNKRNIPMVSFRGEFGWTSHPSPAAWWGTRLPPSICLSPLDKQDRRFPPVKSIAFVKPTRENHKTTSACKFTVIPEAALRDPQVNALYHGFRSHLGPPNSRNCRFERIPQFYG